jgi:hypothetical protein
MLTMMMMMMMMMSLIDKLFGFGEILVPRMISTYLCLAAAAWFRERASERAYVGYVVCTSGVPFSSTRSSCTKTTPCLFVCFCCSFPTPKPCF